MRGPVFYWRGIVKICRGTLRKKERGAIMIKKAMRYARRMKGWRDMLNIATVGSSSIMNVIQEAISLTEGMECRVVYSRDARRAREFASSVGVEEGCADYPAMLKRGDIDIVYIASPNRLHFSQALEALENGKHVICEKPVVVTASEAERLFDAARKNGVFLFEAITTVYMPDYIACRELLPQLGKIREARICYAQYSSRYDAYLRGENPNAFNPAMQGGALNDMGIYCIHTALGLFGSPKGICYKAERDENGLDLSGELKLDYSDFVCGITVSKTADLGSGCHIEGENGRIIEEGPLNDFASCRAEINGKSFIIDEKHAENRMVYELARFRDAILRHETGFFEKTAKQSIEASSILELAHRA